MASRPREVRPPEGALESRNLFFSTNYDGSMSLDEGYLNCPGPAFQNAILTLTKRADMGKKSPQLIDWIRAQDAVFSNCTPL